MSGLFHHLHYFVERDTVHALSLIHISYECWNRVLRQPESFCLSWNAWSTLERNYVYLSLIHISFERKDTLRNVFSENIPESAHFLYSDTCLLYTSRLSKMGIDSFVPVQQQIHQWSDRRKMVDTVLLPMMVFVHVNPKERMEVLSFSTVSRYMVMRGESTPAVIPDEQICLLYTSKAEKGSPYFCPCYWCRT